MGTNISKPAIKEWISATVMVLLGNAYGRSFEAVDPAMIILRKLSRSDWIYYIEEYLYRVIDYIGDYYDALHTTGRQYIIDDINIYIEVRQSSMG